MKLGMGVGQKGEPCTGSTSRVNEKKPSSMKSDLGQGDPAFKEDKRVKGETDEYAGKPSDRK